LTEPERLGEIMAGRGLQPLKGKRRKLELLKIHWAGIAGDREARHSTPTKLSRRVLVVATEGPSWAAELSMKTADLLKGIEEVIGAPDVQKIKIQARSTDVSNERVTERTTGEGRDPVRRESVQLDLEVQEELDSISEEETRGALVRMLKASVASRQCKPDKD
jgi:hypothetical protein